MFKILFKLAQSLHPRKFTHVISVHTIFLNGSGCAENSIATSTMDE